MSNKLDREELLYLIRYVRTVHSERGEPEFQESDEVLVDAILNRFEEWKKENGIDDQVIPDSYLCGIHNKRLTDKKVCIVCEWAESLHSQALEEVHKSLSLVQNKINETYMDERGTVWTIPTPEAYAKACKALHAAHDKIRILQEQVEK